MNIPKPVAWAGLAAMIGVYVYIQPRPEAAHDESSHTHEDGTKHSGSEHSEDEGAAPAAPPASEGKLSFVDVTKGSGAVAAPGKRLTMHYRGTLTNGKQFDSSYDKGKPFEFTLGAGEVIKGWDQGIQGMKVGGKRKLTIPASLAYGARSPSPEIPPNSTLLFDVELLGVQ